MKLFSIFKRESLIPGYREMELHPVTLSFTGQYECVEKQYRDYYLKNYLGQIRLILMFALIMFCSFGIFDAVLMHGDVRLLWTIRYVLVCPVLILGFILTYIDTVKKHIQLMLVAIALITASGVILMIAATPSPMKQSYSAGLILVLVFGYTMARLRFIWAAVSGWLVQGIFNAAVILSIDNTAEMVVEGNFLLTAANILGMIVAYTMEYSDRRDFHLLQLLGNKQQQLEDRVKERTAQLESSNQELIRQIEQRKQVEEKRLELEARLQRVEKMEALGTLAGGVAHDLNNILSGLVSYPDLLLEEFPETDPMHAPLLTIRSSGEKATAIVQDLLALARRETIAKEPVNINEVISLCMAGPDLEKLVSNNKDVEFSFQLDPDLLDVNGSTAHLSRILTTLIENSLELISGSGKICIRTENRYIDKPVRKYDTVMEGEYALLQVKDDGREIPAEDLVKIFEPFYTRKKMGRSGTGLGMAVVWGTVKDHEGYIDISSREGEGTEITLYFPAVIEKRVAEADEQQAKNYRGSGETVLVVDDIEEQRHIARLILESLGYNATCVRSGEEATAYVKENTVDIVLLDMIMDPGIDGLETYRRISKIHPGQKAIITSGYSETERVRIALELGVGEYVKKPYILKIIGQAIQRQLNATRRNNENGSLI